MWESKLTKYEVAGGPAYAFKGAGAPEAPDVLHLLPIYDEYVMGYKDRSAMLQVRRRLGAPPLRFDSMIVRGGEIIGTWRREMGKASIDLVWDPFERPDARTQALVEAAAARFSDFHGIQVNLLRFDPASSARKYRSGWIFANT
jgi:hypothetical protein